MSTLEPVSILEVINPIANIDSWLVEPTLTRWIEASQIPAIPVLI